MSETYLMDTIDVDGLDDMDLDLESSELLRKRVDYEPSDAHPTNEFDKTVADIDFNVPYEGVESPRPARGTLTQEQRSERRRERRQMPTAKVKDKIGRMKRKTKRDVLRQCWLARERAMGVLTRLCLVHAQTAAEQQLCVRFLVESDAVIGRARTLCPESLREEINAIQRWDHASLPW